MKGKRINTVKFRRQQQNKILNRERAESGKEGKVMELMMKQRVDNNSVCAQLCDGEK